jgi:hypothetical protein
MNCRSGGLSLMSERRPEIERSQSLSRFWLSLAIASLLAACGPSRPRHESVSERPKPEVPSDELPPEYEATVAVDATAAGVTLTEYAFGMHASVYDNALQDAAERNLKERLAETGITLLRWPGGGYSDNYHFATHTLTPFYSSGTRGYLARGTDFGSFTGVLDYVGATAMITVNYGSYVAGNGPGEPKEAAAWVAYANGDPEDTTEIGLDSTGEDWKTVGYWASLRASEKLEVDDGKNMLRIARPAPIGIRYWEVGNELFGNGYYTGTYEQDLHVPYDGTPRLGHPALSPTTYGKGVVEFTRAMKAVDPTIRVGAVLNTPPADYAWGRYWNRDTLAQCGSEIDFVMVHWYPSPPSPPRGVYFPDLPRREIPAIRAELEANFAECCAERSEPLEIAVTELGPNVASRPSALESTLFATDAYVTFFEHGMFNVDWLELHNGSFLREGNSYVDHRGPAFKGLRIAHEFVGPGDRFVKAESSVPQGIRSHAAVRPDGSVALLLINLARASRGTALIQIDGVDVAGEAQRHDYRPNADALDGQVSGPMPVASGNSFSLVLEPRSMVTLVIPPL